MITYFTYIFHHKNHYIQLMERGGTVYILTNKNHTVLYTGVTRELYSRVIEHQSKVYPKSFTSKYNCTKLVYYVSFGRIEEAIAREKQIKGGSRQDKLDLINAFNPSWDDLFEVIKKW